ncbi:OmpA family protein [Marinivivus vitaminiproducens]|uniref:OmpA family protein n=1 Tax=Marinivivus vitaminiproducens TaxID=3035935 RepID=UPI0027A26B1F|nr:OmpA family protein [Geminicoccaceae bacterium SCSIO 64248]
MIHRPRRRLCLLACLSVIGLAGCTTYGDGATGPSRTAIGTGIGAAAGGILGRVLANDNRDWATAGGAALGAAAGGGLGYLLDGQERELRDRLAQKDVEIDRVQDDLLKLTLRNEVLFDVDSALLKPAFAPTIQTLADVLGKYDRTRVQVVGYTDSTGPEAYNQSLSERRAEAVVNELALAGVPRERMAAFGRGEAEPRADNATSDGRQLNRRVEIFVQPVDSAVSSAPAAPQAPPSDPNAWQPASPSASDGWQPVDSGTSGWPG